MRERLIAELESALEKVERERTMLMEALRLLAPPRTVKAQPPRSRDQAYLDALDHIGPTTQAEVARKAGIPPGSMGGITRRLKAAGAITAHRREDGQTIVRRAKRA